MLNLPCLLSLLTLLTFRTAKLLNVLVDLDQSQKLMKACNRRMLFLDQEVASRDANSESFQEEIGKLRSLEDSEKSELKKDKTLLQDQLSVKTAELESLRSAQTQLIAQAKLDAVAVFLTSDAYTSEVEQTAALRVAECKKSPTLGRIFVDLMTQVHSLGFTEGVDCLKDGIPGFNLESLPEDKKPFYDADAGENIDTLIAEHGIFTDFASSTDPSPETEAPDRLSNS